ncbi:unnamed protein product [Phytophthora fragariaefolia]|uniref:Unnamed protein product n=1 Tax=Phytophthora fragariaefolia TaxID=1490495 RepID=A0A9W6YB91_9STRA|nr:unnamed protein product [Phytophthora fragariaefolia]
MRWESTVNNSSVSVGVPAYTLASRDECASYNYYQEPSAPLTVPTVVSKSHARARRVVDTKKPPDRRVARAVVGNNTPPSHESKEPSSAGEEAADRPEGTPDEAESIKAPIIMCAGKSVYGGLGVNQSRSNNEFSQRIEHLLSINNDADTDPSNQTATFRSAAATKPKKSNEPYSPQRHRTDEELEQIIRDLRHQVFRQQQQQQQQQQLQEKQQQKSNHEQRLKPTSAVSTGAAASQTQSHTRKHLKNPVEKMQRAAPTVPLAASIGSTVVTNNGLLLQRPLSTSYLSKLVAESTIQMVAPAIIYEAPAAATRGSKFSGSTHVDGKVSSLDLCSLRSTISRSRPTSSPGYHIAENPSWNSRVRSKQTSASRQVRRGKTRGQDDVECSSDFDDNFLYLVDAEDSEDWPVSVALSPVGPWVVEDFATITARASTDSPHSPVSICHSISSLGSTCDDSEVWSSNELATMSPRSRLLYFSACVDDAETPRSTCSQLEHQQTLHRSATCGSDLLGNTKLPGTRPKRCSSAKTTRIENDEDLEVREVPI